MMILMLLVGPIPSVQVALSLSLRDASLVLVHGHRITHEPHVSVNQSAKTIVVRCVKCEWFVRVTRVSDV